ncbi:MAG TPA: threonine--tRNA ligase [Nitrospinota bacterium]|nr:threonine--tRNA ligase [Nitrospinota bacterium]
MEKIKIRFPEGKEIQCPQGTTIKEMIIDIKGDTRKIIAAKINGNPVDLSLSLNSDADIEWITLDSEEGKEIYRHSTSHILAQAVKELFQGVQITIGPAIKDGFYYDFDYKESFTDDDLKKIEGKMLEIIKRNQPFIREEVSKEKAIEEFKKLGENYKVELIKEIEDNAVTLYKSNGFLDLCRGPHVPSTGVVSHFKLLNVAGAYWRGDENNKMLQRIYGTSFPTAKELKDYLTKLEEVKKRDHRVLGKKLDLFSIHDEAGAGLIYWHPKGTIIKKIIERFWEDEHIKRGYQLVSIPHIVRDQLFKTSGHYEFYRENMFVFKIDENEYVVKPMNCPGHIMIYRESIKSYRDLPLKFAELGTVYRYERSGVLHGMLRVRGFTQDDAHIFCTPEQLPNEILKVIDLARYMLETFGYKEFDVSLSVRDESKKERYAGEDREWKMAEEALMKTLEKRNMSFERVEGEAVFYGPKIDIKMLDALGRGWQGPTIQFDFNLPKRFDVTYVGEDGAKHHVVMVHRTVLGSMERFIGGLIEHYAGAFPVWLSPVQVKILSITDRQKEYSEHLEEMLRENGIRTETDLRNEKIGYKVRESEMEKVPYMLILGDREMESEMVSVRERGKGDLGSIKIEDFIKKIMKEILDKR